MTAIILAAGQGTRMKSDLPKVLHKVCGRHMLAYVLKSCQEAGCDRLIAVIGHGSEMVREAFAELDRDVEWVEQTPQLGTGHAVMVCADKLVGLEGPVLVVAGDGPLIRARTLRTLRDAHDRQKAACTLATSILPDPGRYGRILRDANGDLLGIVEYLDADERRRRINEVNVSLYCFDAAALRGVKVAAVAAVEPDETLSINTPEQLRQVERIMESRLGKCGGSDRA